MARKWVKYIKGLGEDCSFADPCPVAEVAAAALSLRVALPDELREILLETNGVKGEYGEELVWPIDRIVSENLDFRRKDDFKELYMPLDHLLFFADGGDGNRYAFPMQGDGLIHRPDIFSWNHETDSREWAAPSLALYFEKMFSGELDS